ncbi:hypothetical protein A6V39_03885 [Candidatus Mycoplasma haematobovis]|uniref:Uncharacterized protein n=1 Tax=Candidatus Mycoplasma haematobovis TaxID=432608 RepID=A0A1A9QCR7_9MOLU|nr:hypothetical protein [Candidatus Mycoplasma haematobovis]OAL10028.1 hypothetical protein A6V39_03885 [Candidatus Mycoplasma haematobovis]
MIGAGKAGLIGAITLASAGTIAGIGYSTGLFNSNTQINELLKKENKHILLSSKSGEDTTGWTEAWKKYWKNKVWGEITGSTEDQVPERFKTLCGEKAKESVYDTKDPKYINITKFCSRDKTIKDVLNEEGFKFLSETGKDKEWQDKFDNYKSDQNTLKLPGVTIDQGDTKDKHHNKISKGCVEAVKAKTTDKGYEDNLAAIRHWCKE